jgi:hypothetical protein
VPVPNLTKKSRGRKVPTVNERSDGESAVDDDYSPSGRLRNNTSDGGKVKSGRGGGVAGATSGRTYRCTAEDCGKCFIRGEHLKRHIRSIHTNEKRQYFKILFSVGIADDSVQRIRALTRAATGLSAGAITSHSTSVSTECNFPTGMPGRWSIKKEFARPKILRKIILSPL